MNTDITQTQFSYEDRAISRWSRVKETLLTSSLGEIPRPFDVLVRRYLYRFIFARIGKNLYIQKGVEILGGKSIEIGDRVKILSNACLNGYAPLLSCSWSSC